MLRGRLNITDRPVRVLSTSSITESVRIPSRVTEPSPPSSRMLTRSRPPHGSSSVIPRGEVAVWFSVNSVSTRSACTVAIRIVCTTGSAAAVHASTAITAPAVAGSRLARRGRAHQYVASTLTAHTPRPMPRKTVMLRSCAGSVASSTSACQSRKAARAYTAPPNVGTSSR